MVTDDFEYNDKLGIRTIFSDKDGYSFTWNPTAYYSSFKNYNVSLYAGSGEIKEEFNDINHTEYNIATVFFPHRFSIRIGVNDCFLLDTILGTNSVQYADIDFTTVKVTNGSDGKLFLKQVKRYNHSEERLMSYSRWFANSPVREWRVKNIRRQYNGCLKINEYKSNCK